jgi:UDP-galactopyranose mutase
MFDYIIVGAGYAGCVTAERIATQLNKKVLIIEQRKHIAGNCFDFRDENNILVHKYGPHLFHTNNSKVFNYLSKFTSWSIYNHEVLALIDGKKVPIPFNLNTIYEIFPVSLAGKLEKKLLNKFEYNAKVPILDLRELIDDDTQFLANYIYEKVFLNYTAKQWCMKPEKMDRAVSGRVPILIGRDNRYFNDKYQAVPTLGYTKMFDNILNNNNIKIMLNTNFHEVCKLNNQSFHFMDKPYHGKVIYTGAIDELFDYQYGELPYRSVDMRFETIDNEYFQEKTTVNYPNNYDFTRITEFKHIHPVKTNKTTILKEYPKEYIPGQDVPYYPIFTAENRSKYDQYFQHSKNIDNLMLLGRLAEYKYYDMDDIVARALEFFENDLSQQT